MISDKENKNMSKNLEELMGNTDVNQSNEDGKQQCSSEQTV